MVEDDPTVDERSTVDSGSATGSKSVPSEGTAERYVLRAPIGRGGMGEVLAAHDVQIGRDVAIKRLHTTAPTERQLRRFLREAQIQGRLEHPSIVPVHEIGRDSEGRVFFAMKKLAGTTLAELMPTGAGRQRLMRAFVEVCLAVAYAHANGVIHRDLKPDNIVLGEFGEVYVLDWGVAKLINETEESDERDSFDDIRADRSGTVAGVVVGTHAYMSPEQAKGVPDIDARTDVFALGRILHEILGDDPPAELAAITTEATAPDRRARLSTARELGERVQRYLDGDRDLELRRDLAHVHLTHATELAKADTTDAHSEALGAVGRALALDPTNTDALRTLVTLLTSPPRDVPAAAVEDMHASERALDRTRARAGVASIGVLWLITLFVWPVVGIRDAGLYALMMVPLTVALVFAVIRLRQPRRDGRIQTYHVIVMSAVIAGFAAGFHPDLLTPPLAVVFIIPTMLGIDARRRYLPLAAAALAFIVPAVLDWLNVVPTGLVQRGDLLCMVPRATSLPATHGVGSLLGNLTLLTIAWTFMWRFRQVLTREQRRNSINAWQLRQLIPTLDLSPTT